MSESATTEHFGFLLIPNFSNIGFTCAVEPMRMANWLLGRPAYRYSTLSADGALVPASNGLRTAADYAIAEAPPLDVLFVCGPTPICEDYDHTILQWLQRLARQGRPIGSLCTGSHLLARAGLLDGYRATIHWINSAGLREQFPRISVSGNVFEIDRDRYTCSGGTAPMDLMLYLIGQRFDQNLVADISEQFILERVRGTHERQRQPMRVKLGTDQPALTEAALLMESNIEEPLSSDEIASHTGISRRQLERLFRSHLDCSPSQHYLNLRLERARELLMQTALPIREVCSATGFVSYPHFSRCYSQRYGISPSAERRLRRARLV